MCGWLQLISGGGGGGALSGRYIGVAGSLGMSLKDDGEGSKGDAVMIVGGGACTGSCGVSDRYCCRLHGVI